MILHPLRTTIQALLSAHTDLETARVLSEKIVGQMEILFRMQISMRIQQLTEEQLKEMGYVRRDSLDNSDSSDAIFKDV